MKHKKIGRYSSSWRIPTNFFVDFNGPKYSEHNTNIINHSRVNQGQQTSWLSGEKKRGSWIENKNKLVVEQ